MEQQSKFVDLGDSLRAEGAQAREEKMIQKLVADGACPPGPKPAGRHQGCTECWRKYFKEEV